MGNGLVLMALLMILKLPAETKKEADYDYSGIYRKN